MGALPSSRRSHLVTATLMAALVAALVWLGCGERRESPTALDERSPSVSLQAFQERFAAAQAAQERHTQRLFTLPEVVGTAVGLAVDGQPAVKVYTRGVRAHGIPTSLDGIPVEIEVTGPLFALQGKIDPKSRFPRPVPIGVSTGNGGECSAGTIGARVQKGGQVYALSNNHVYALENDAAPGSQILQPGRYDTNCALSPADVIGTLADFEPIVFSTSASNRIDAAIALSSTANLGRATPANGYGTPQSAPVAAVVGQAVQKYGRTTALTKGQVSGVNAIVNVGYSSGTARFVDQIVVSSRKPFSKAGDSGSLIVTDAGRNPVGLLFAGTQDGKTTIANRIDLVLGRFGASVDGQ